jgi:hypothetical protein
MCFNLATVILDSDEIAVALDRRYQIPLSTRANKNNLLLNGAIKPDSLVFFEIDLPCFLISLNCITDKINKNTIRPNASLNLLLKFLIVEQRDHNYWLALIQVKLLCWDNWVDTFDILWFYHTGLPQT